VYLNLGIPASYNIPNTPFSIDLNPITCPLIEFNALVLMLDGTVYDSTTLYNTPISFNASQLPLVDDEID